MKKQKKRKNQGEEETDEEEIDEVEAVKHVDEEETGDEEEIGGVEAVKHADEVEKEVQWETSEAVQAVKEGDIVVVRSGDTFNSYYLMCAVNEVELLETNFKDNYGHLHVQGSSVLRGHYLEEMQRKASSTLLQR